MVITEPFPRAPLEVIQMLDDLARAQMLTARLGGTDPTVQAELDQFGDVDLLPRPWDPPTCPPAIRTVLWEWLDDVAAWLNGDYAWHVDRVLPPCWPAHPHLAHELALLACLRLQAGQALSPDPIEEWHRWALPSFVDRAQAQLGSNPCPPGKHTTWPARTRYDDFTSELRRQDRRAVFEQDCAAPARR